jgi:hypothetical protein
MEAIFGWNAAQGTSWFERAQKMQIDLIAFSFRGNIRRRDRRPSKNAARSSNFN